MGSLRRKITHACEPIRIYRDARSQGVQSKSHHACFDGSERTSDETKARGTLSATQHTLSYDEDTFQHGLYQPPWNMIASE